MSSTHQPHLIWNRKRPIMNTSTRLSFFISFRKQFRLQMNYAGLDGTSIPTLRKNVFTLLCISHSSVGKPSRCNFWPSSGLEVSVLSFLLQNTAKAYKPNVGEFIFFFQAHWAHKSSLRKKIRFLDFYFVWPENQSPICEALYCYIHLQCTKITLRDCNAQSYFSVQ